MGWTTTWKIKILGLFVALAVWPGVLSCGSVGVSKVAPSGGSNIPVAVELPNISLPTTVATKFSGFAKDVVDSTFLAHVVPSGPQGATQILDLIDTTLNAFEGMSCPRTVGNTSCQFTNSNGQTVDVDFGSFNFAAEFPSANNTNQSCNLSCVADTATVPTSTTSLCVRTWVDGVRTLIGKFNVVPVAGSATNLQDRGAGCFILTSDNSVAGFGLLYDQSNRAAAAATGINAQTEVFANQELVADRSHFFVSYEGADVATQLVNFKAYLNPDDASDPQILVSRWFQDVDLVLGNYVQGSQSTADACTTKAGVTISGCTTSTTAHPTEVLTSQPLAPATVTTVTVATTADFTSPSIAIFPDLVVAASTPKALITGFDTTMVLKSDGLLWGWGRNSFGQLADGTRLDRDTPQRVAGITGVRQVAPSQKHTIAVKDDGTVWAWGDNSYGQLGDGTTTDHYTPAVVPGLVNVIRVATGSYVSAALKSDGTVWTWGNNTYGQLGNNTTSTGATSAPVQVLGSGGTGFLFDVGDIACQALSCFALKSDGTVWGWGYNGTQGRLGVGTTTTNYLTPAQVVGVGGGGTLSNVTRISTLFIHVLALLGDGTVVNWGSNFDGQLATGNTTDQISPVAVSGVSGVVAVSAGYGHSLALKSDGTVVGWGQGSAFGAASNTGTIVSSPTAVSGITQAITAGAGNGFSMFLKEGGVLQGVGVNYYGQLGDGTTTLYNSKGYVQSTITGVSRLGNAGSSTLHAFAPNGTWYSWGRNADAEILPSTDPAFETGWDNMVYPPYANSPAPLSVASGQYFTLLLQSDGKVLAWGRNVYGQLGNGTTTAHYDHTTEVSTLTNVTQIDPGRDHALAVESDGTVWTWGENSYKQIGDGTTTVRTTPYQVTISNVVDAAASFHNLVASSDGSVWAWGKNASGQLGDGGSTNQGAPVQVKGVGGTGTLANISKVGIGRDHSYALKTDGTVWAWGRNASGQLGDGSQTNRSTPVQVVGLSNVTQLCKLSSDGNFSAAIKSDGTVWTWGVNTYGQLGTGNTTDQLLPAQVLDTDGVTPISDATAVSCAQNGMVVLTQSGRVIQWGYDTTGTGMNPAGISNLMTTLLTVTLP